MKESKNVPTNLYNRFHTSLSENKNYIIKFQLIKKKNK